jgi:hypothetical protein
MFCISFDIDKSLWLIIKGRKGQFAVSNRYIIVLLSRSSPAVIDLGDHLVRIRGFILKVCALWSFFCILFEFSINIVI